MSREARRFFFISFCLCTISVDLATFTLKNLAGKIICRTFAALEPAKPLNDAQMCGSFFLYKNE